MRKFFISAMVLFTSIAASMNGLDTRVHAKTQTLAPVHRVTIKAPYGYANGPISVTLSDSEWRVIQRLEPLTKLPSIVQVLPTDTIDWRIEPAAVGSKTLYLSDRALQDTRKYFAAIGVGETWKTTIVIARTQSFIKQELKKLNCYPNLQLTRGVFVMGAAVCDYRVIVINLTGYFFYRYAGQTITAAMENRPEPTLANTYYLNVDRNISGLAHEWMHVVRGSLAEGYVPPDEPAWFREGLAEIMSGLARASSFNKKLNYQRFHVIRIRKFSSWNYRCLKPLSNFRISSSTVSGCEYLRGATAIELLLAYHGGLPNIARLYQDLVNTNDFTTSFRNIYKMSISTFERVADRYANDIHRAASLDN